MSNPRHARVIHCAWFQGLDAAPAVVRFNLARWASLNPLYRIKVVDQAGAEAVLAGSGISIDGLAPQALSDMVRLKLLHDHGGVWVDASLTPILPLDDWLPRMTAPSGFFAFSRPWPHVIIASWFLAAAPANPVVAAWWRETCRYWSRPRRFVPGEPASPAESISPQSPDWLDAYPYNWVQYLLEHRVDRDGSVTRALEGDAHMSGIGGRRLREALLEGERDLRILRSRASEAPVQKLDWRRDWPLDLLRALSPGVDDSR